MDYLNQFITSLTSRIGEILPNFTGALVVLLIGFLVAVIVRRIIRMVFKRTKLSEKINTQLDSGFELDKFIASTAYYLILVYVLLLVLGMMGIDGVLAPLSDMMSKFLSFLPNIIGAVIIAAVGYVIAKLLSEATSFITASVQSFSERSGLNTSLDLGNIIRQVVFLLVFIPILITALDTLNMKAISEPATEMFAELLTAIPNILAAALILAVFYIVGRYVTTMLTELLGNLGIDKLSESIGMSDLVGKENSLSKMIGHIVFFFLLFGGIIAAVDKLNLPQVSSILDTIFNLSGKIILGIVLLFIGNYLSILAQKALAQSEDSKWVGTLARVVILGLFLALGLDTMGIASDIINLAFGISVGAVAFAFALAFGLGGKDSAGKYAEKLFGKVFGKL